MSPIHILRSLVNERLAAAAEEIFGLFERTIIEYEGEIDRQRKLMDVVKPEMTTDSSGPQLSFYKEEVPPRQQERNPSLVQEELEPPQIKEEQEDLWSSQEVLEEAEIMKFTSAAVSVKCADGEEKAHCSWFNQTQPGETTEAEPLPRTSTEPMETEPDGEDCGASEPASNLDPAGGLEQLFSSECSGAESEHSDDWKETGQPQSGVKTLKSEHTDSNSRVKGQSLSFSNSLLSGEVSHEVKPSNQFPYTPCCKVCGGYFPNKVALNRHVKVHSSDCGLCGKCLEPTESLKRHLEAHRICTVCGEGFTRNFDIMTHMRTHTGEKPFRCTVCGKGFSQSGNCNRHIRTHTNEKPFSCSLCGRGFNCSGNLKSHIKTHSNNKPFCCTVCGKDFRHSISVKKHMKIHLNGKVS